MLTDTSPLLASHNILQFNATLQTYKLSKLVSIEKVELSPISSVLLQRYLAF